MLEDSYDTPEFRARQKEHAEDIRNRREQEKRARSGEDREPTLREADVMRMIENAMSRLRIAGPGVSGDAKSGWAINPPPLTATAVTDCDADPPTTTFTFNQ